MSDDIRDLLTRPCGWLDSTAIADRAVISSRVRLARNLADHPFRRKLGKDDQRMLVRSLLPVIAEATGWSDALQIDLESLPQQQRQALSERQLISRDLAYSRSPGGAVLRADQRACIMINEEDHLRLQVIGPGLDITGVLASAIELDRRLEARLHWATDSTYGYLTACPTNLGTGLRISAMTHLPALAATDRLKQALSACKHLHMAVRGLFGEGSESAGDLYQISNQRTLGLTEEDLARQLEETVATLCRYEHMAREALLVHDRIRLEDGVFRAWGLLTQARSLTSSELIEQLSWLRLGMDAGLLGFADWAAVDRLLVFAQPAHMEIADRGARDARSRDRLRATLVRSALQAA